MELFYSNNMENGICTLNEEESRHCSKVLRHVPGDTINIIDGCGFLYTCRIIECGKQVVCSVEQVQENFGAHRYHLTMAVCPTKNIDRYEWFLEKATEMGIDVVAPVIGEHSERRIIKPERLEKILVSAAKQSLKGAVPVLRETVPVKEFIRNAASLPGVKLIAYCGEQDKVTLAEAIAMAKEQADASGSASAAEGAMPTFGKNTPAITILIGPEGDFSPAEVEAAMAAGFHPLTLGSSRLRTETAAVAAVAGVYFMI
ncbi:MAG: 16S rRNA (uracil(1498)-N(3))-methyltransferase [Bacteroidales bacterium]|nr:16S rRNA (uracil(1498)-N(3))-methyltransferase [Bacteroidales bacterium]